MKCACVVDQDDQVTSPCLVHAEYARQQSRRVKQELALVRYRTNPNDPRVVDHIARDSGVDRDTVELVLRSARFLRIRQTKKKPAG